MSYEVVLTKTANRFLSDLNKRDYALVMEKLLTLADEPLQSGVKKLKGYDNVYRIRAGSYRILYEIEFGILKVIVIDIGHRKDIYQ